MFVTNASVRRYIRQQLETIPDAPPKCVERYECYVWCVLNGDVHTANMKMAGLTNRDQAKTFIYAFLYGAGAAKIGKVVGRGRSRQLTTKQVMIVIDGKRYKIIDY